MNVRKAVNVLLALMLVLLAVLPAPVSSAAGLPAETLGDTPAAWPAVFSPYKLADGGGIYDPAGDIHPTDVDITSGVDRGTGSLDSMYVASDGTNFFVRLRVKGDPYDRKGGFLSSVWLVQLGVGGEQKATIGLNGKSPHVDYVYVANENGTNVQPVYTTTAAGNQVAGTRITPADNGQYFIDFQVPVNRITAIAPEITDSTPVQYFFGTSKAANLSVINKEWMGAGNTVHFSGLAETNLAEQPVSVAIDGGTSKAYSTSQKTMTGTASIQSGAVFVSINNGTPVETAVVNYKWSYVLPDSILASNGIHKAAVTVSNNSQTEKAMQDVMITSNADTLTINGGAVAVTGSTAPTLSGTYAGSNSQNVRVMVYVDGALVESKGAALNSGSLTWSLSVPLNAPVEGKKYAVKAVWTNTSGNTTYATATQDLTYKSGTVTQAVAVGMSPTVSGTPVPAVSGTSSGADQVEVRIDGASTEFAKPASDGTWSIAALEKPLSAGNHTITAIATNASGNSSATSQTHSVTATSITIDNGLAVTTVDSQPTIRGNTNAVNNTPISVKVGEYGILSTVAAEGRWSAEFPSETQIPDGAHTVTATVNGTTVTNQQQLTIDTSTNVAIISPANNASTSEKRPVLSGTAEANATVNVVLKNSSNTVVDFQTLSAGNTGNWSYTPAKDLTEGAAYQAEVTASDESGNEADAASTFNITAAAVNVTSAEPVWETAQIGTGLEDAKALLGAQVNVKLSDNTVRLVNVTWTSENYNGNQPGEYAFTGALTLPAGVTNTDSIQAAGTVAIYSNAADILTYSLNGHNGTIDSVNKTIHVQVPHGTGKNQLVASFALSPSATAAVGPAAQESGATVNDFSSPVVYTVTAEDGTTAKNWTVTVTEAMQDQTAQPVITVPVYEGDMRVSGTAEPGAEVTLTAGAQTKTAKADSSGSWAIEELTLTKGQVITVTAEASGKPTSTPAVTTVLAYEINTVSSASETVAYGTSLTDAKAALGTEATVTWGENQTGKATVTWNEVSYDGSKAGSYTFTGTLSHLPPGTANTENIQAQGTVNVLPEMLTVKNAAPVGETVENGTSLAGAKAALGTTVEVTLSDATKRTVSVAWSEPSTPEYAGTTAGSYVFKGTISGLPENVSNPSHVAAAGTVLVKAATITKATSVTKKVDYGTSLAEAKAVLGTKVAVTWGNSQTGEATVTWNEASYNGSKAGSYTFTGELSHLPAGTANGGNVKAHGTVEVLPEKPVVQSATPVQRPVKNGTSLADAKAALGTTVDVTLSNGQTATVPVTWSVQSAPEYTGTKMGSYVFTGTIGTLPANTFNTKEIKAKGTVLAEAVDMTKAPLTKQTVVKGTSEGDLLALLPESLTVDFENSETAAVPVTWTTVDYNGSKTGSYTAKGKFHSYPSGVQNSSNVTAAAEIEVVEPLAVTGSMDGVQTVTVGDAVPDAAVRLYDKNKKAVQAKTAGPDGSVVFKDVAIGTGYYATQTVKESETAPSKEVNVYPQITVRYSEGDIWESTTKSVYAMENVIGTALKWSSSNENVLAISKVPMTLEGDAQRYYEVTVKRPAVDTSVILTAAVEFEGKEVHRTFLIVVKAQGYQTEKQTVSTDNSVTVGGQPLSAGIKLTRTSLKPLNEGGTVHNQLVDKLIVKDGAALGNGDVSISFHNKSADGVRADEQAVELSLNVLRGLTGYLTVVTPEGTFHLPQKSVDDLAATGSDLYFRVVPIRSAAGQQEVINRTKASMQAAAGAGKRVKVLDIPREIETNYRDINTDITLPLPDLTESQISGLRLLIEHSDGTEEVIVPGQNGEIVRENGVAVGLKFRITHFSMFTFFQVTNAPAPPAGGGTIVLPQVAVTAPADGQVAVNNAPAASGTATANHAVSIYLDGKLIGETKTDSSGSWTHALPASLATGTHTVSASVKASNGTQVNSNTVSFEFEVLEVAIQTSVDGRFIVNTVPAVTGTAGAGQKVILYLDGKLIGTATANSKGSWTHKLPAGLAEGVHTVQAAVEASDRTEVKSKPVSFEFATSKQHIHYIVGFKDGEFKPTAAVTRAQMAAMLSRNLTANQVPAAITKTYSDIGKSWAYNEIEFASSVKIMQGFSNQTFKPGQEVTRAQMAAIAIRWIDRQCAENPDSTPHCELSGQKVAYTDMAKNHWAADAIYRISRTGIMEGMGDGTFEPESPLTRAQAVKVLNRLFGRGPLEGVPAPSFPDVPASHWAYKEIEEAATVHTYIVKDGKEMFYK